MKKIFFLAIATLSLSAMGQTKKGPTVPENPNQKESRSLIIEGTEALVNQDGGVVDFDAFAKAESKLRTAIALTPESVPASYNAGNNYYQNKKWQESTSVLLKATTAAQTKKEKHKAFHNLGNAFYQQENWDGAVEAYKNALRADPTDEETRYNLQMAKKEKDKEGGGGSGDDNKEDQEKDQGDNKDKNEKDNKGDGDKKEGDNGDEEETDDEGKDKKKDGEQKEDDNGKPKDQDQKKDGGKGDQKQPPPQPQQGQLSPQQVQNLLKAMQDQEQKTQEKINAQKVKGARVKTEKDW